MQECNRGNWGNRAKGNRGRGMAVAVFITGGARSGKSGFAEAYAMKSAHRGIYIATSQSWDDEMRERTARHQAERDRSGFAWTTVEEPLAVAELLERMERESRTDGRADLMVREDRGDDRSDRVEREERGKDRAGRTVSEDRGDDYLEQKGFEGRDGRTMSAEDRRPAVLVDCMTLWLTNWLLKLDSGTDGRLDQAGEEALRGETDRLVAAVGAYTGPLWLVTNEVGSGIVPAYPLGRRFRDEAGRLNRRLAAACSEAYLVVAGLPLDLKKHAFQLGED